MCGIYKITNLCNGKSYIGQSVDIEARWRKHKTCTLDYAISRAFRKYGLDNFEFTIVEECSKEQLNERECYWINYYDSFFHGYNETLGGSAFNSGFIPKEDVLAIINLLLEGKMTNREIAAKFEVNENSICAINVGRTWRRPDLIYPLRPYQINTFPNAKEERKKMPKETYHCIDCGAEISRGAERCPECANKKTRKVERPTAEELVQLLKDNNGNFSKVGRIFGVTSNAIAKWCKSYGLPWHSGDYKIVKPKGEKTMPIPVEQWTTDGRLVATFTSLTEAEQKTGITHIREASDTNNTSRKTAGGYIWKRLI